MRFGAGKCCWTAGEARAAAGTIEDLSQQRSHLSFIKPLIKSTVPVVKIVTVSYSKNDLAFAFKKTLPLSLQDERDRQTKDICSTEYVIGIRPGSFMTS